MAVSTISVHDDSPRSNLPTLISADNQKPLYCSICGAPMISAATAADFKDHMSHLAWLGQIVVLPLKMDRLTVTHVQYISSYQGDFLAWDRYSQIRAEPCIPLHTKCCQFAQEVVAKEKSSTTSFAHGGPPRSLYDIWICLIARVYNTEDRFDQMPAMFRLNEPSWYNGFDNNMPESLWSEDYWQYQLQGIWLLNPIDLPFAALAKPATQDIIFHSIPYEIVEMIFQYLTPEDTTKAPYIFPQEMWRKRDEEFSFLLDGLDMPIAGNYEALAQELSDPDSTERCALLNRYRIRSLIEMMHLNDMYDLRVAYCGCDGFECEVREHSGELWCRDKWADVDELLVPDDLRVPLRRELFIPPLRLLEDGRLVAYYPPAENEPVEEYIVNSYVNNSFTKARQQRRSGKQ